MWDEPNTLVLYLKTLVNDTIERYVPIKTAGTSPWKLAASLGVRKSSPAEWGCSENGLVSIDELLD